MATYNNERGWAAKFRNAFRGLVLGIRGESSFYVHLPMAVAVIAVALMLGLDSLRICLLLLCIGGVISAELFNSCIERLAQAITQETDQNVGRALDIASSAVLSVSICSVVIGLVILGPPLIELF